MSMSDSQVTIGGRRVAPAAPTYPNGFTSAKHAEAHLLDAHGIHALERESLADLIAFHHGLHQAPWANAARIPHDHATTDEGRAAFLPRHCRVCGEDYFARIRPDQTFPVVCPNGHSMSTRGEGHTVEAPETGLAELRSRFGENLGARLYTAVR